MRGIKNSAGIVRCCLNNWSAFCDPRTVGQEASNTLATRRPSNLLKDVCAAMLMGPERFGCGSVGGNSEQGFWRKNHAAGDQSSKSRTPRLWRIAVEYMAVVGIIGITALLATHIAVRADPPDTGRTEQWGPQEDDLQTRLVPLADHFTLGQPMRFRLELKNVGQTLVYYDTQQVAINGSLVVRGPRVAPLPLHGPVVPNGRRPAARADARQCGLSL